MSAFEVKSGGIVIKKRIKKRTAPDAGKTNSQCLVGIPLGEDLTTHRESPDHKER